MSQKCLPILNYFCIGIAFHLILWYNITIIKTICCVHGSAHYRKEIVKSTWKGVAAPGDNEQLPGLQSDEFMGDNMDKNYISSATKKSKKSLWLRVKAFIYIPVTILVAYLLFGVILIYGIVPTASMEPTCMAGSMYLGNRLAYTPGDVQRGDPIFFHFTEDNGSKAIYLKRVIGLPGDTVSFIEGKVYVNGSPLDESEYLDSTVETDAAGGVCVFNVPSNCYFVLGDNRTNSYDSRFWENPFVSRDAIIAKYLGSVFIPFLKAA